MSNAQSLADPVVRITGRRLAAPPGPIFHLQRSAQADYEIGEFRAWAGYKDLGSAAATHDLAHFQHVVSFAGAEVAGRTGVHVHLAHAHIVIPTSGRGVFSYDGVVTEAAPGTVIVQHGGTVHDQFEYSFAGGSEAENRRTPQSLDPVPAGAPIQSFGFLELFVPKAFANVEIVPPHAVTEQDQATAWDHPYHRDGASFGLQTADAPDAAYRPVAGRADLEVRDANTWGPSASLVATWILRPTGPTPASGPAVNPIIPGETGGIEIFYMATGSASLQRDDGVALRLEPGDALTCSQGAVGLPFACSADMRLLRFLIAAGAQDLHERTAEEIARLEDLGPAIITARRLRADGDARPINGLHSA